MMDSNGKNQKQIANYASDPAWSPDGKSLAIFGWDGDPRGSQRHLSDQRRRHERRD